MKSISVRNVMIVLALSVSVGLFFVPETIYGSQSNRIDATITITVCGNLLIESGEECDQTNLAGRTCTELGYSGGTLACYPDCSLNKTACTGGGTTGGGGGGGYVPVPLNSVNITGRAYPLSKVSILKDGQFVASTIAGPDAKFSVAINGLSPGTYLFSVFGEDKNGAKSALFSFSVGATTGATTNISGVYIPPTISVNNQQVKRGDNVILFGNSTPDSEITIKVNSAQELFFRTNSDKNGSYLYNLDTTPLEQGNHESRSKSASGGEISNYSEPVAFVVGDKTIEKPLEKIMKGDLNKDKKVNLVDFSIAAYWYKRDLSIAFKVIESERLNNDGKINLVDFSILAYYWTG